MKKILFLLLLISSVASAQYSPTGSKTRFVNGIGLSSKDTTGWTSADTLVIIMGLDSVPYYRYKGYWKPLKGGSGGSVAWNDITGKPSNFPTTFALSNDIPDSIRLRLLISDTATMLLPYARVSDIDNKLLLKVNYGDTAAMLNAYREKDISHDASIISLNEDTATLVERFSNQTNLANSKLSGITAISPLSSTGGTNPIISIPLATNSTNGYLSASDRTAFNNKQAALGFTPENIANKNVANGYAGLDANSKIPLDLLSNTVLAYKGLWNANTNTPTLADGTGTSGWVYVVSVGGTRNLGSGNITFNVGDYVLYNGSIWQANTGGNQVVSVAVNGSTPQQGIVNITLPNSSVTNSQLLNNSVTIGSTTTALGGTSTSLSGLTSVSATNLSGGGTGLTSLPTNTGLYPTLPYLSTNGGNVNGAVNVTGKLTLTDSLKGTSIKLSSGADNKLLASSGVQLTVGSGLNITGNVISGTSGSNVVGQSPISVSNGVVSIGTPVPTSLGGTGSSIATSGLSNLRGMQQVVSSSTAVVLTNTSPSEIQVTGTIAQNINLPDPSTLVIGYVLKVYNISSQTVTVRAFGGSPSVATIAANTLSEFTLINTSFTGASAWRSRVVGFAFTTGTGGVVRATSPTLSTPNLVSPTITGGTLTSSTLVLPTISSITVSGGVATMPTGNGTLAYTAQLDNYKLKSDTGFVGGYTTRERTKQQTDSLSGLINILAEAAFIDNINAVPKWAGLSYIESNITDNGTKITLGGTALALSALASSNSKIPIVLPSGDVSTLDTGRTATALITGGIAKRITDSLGSVKQNFNANTTTLGNSTTGTGAIVRQTGAILNASTLTLPKISSIEAPNTNYITVPSASGTMALTSDLGNYLPLSGGNLTGVVNSTTRLNLGGATDNAAYNFNVNGNTRTSLTAMSGNYTTDGSQFFSFALRGRQSDEFGAFGYYSSDGGTRYGYIQSGNLYGGQLALSGDGGQVLSLDSRGAGFSSMVNINGASSNSLFSLNNNGVAYTKGFAPSLNTYSSNITLSDGHTYVYNGGIPANWLLPAAVGNNQAYIVKNEGTGNLNLATQFGNQIINSDGQALNSLVIAPNECYYFQQNASNKYYVLFKQGGAGTDVVTLSTAQDITGRKKFVGGFDVGLSGSYTEMNFFSGTNAPDQQYGKIYYGPATGSGTDFKIQAPNGNLSLTTGSGWSTSIGRASITIANISGLNLNLSNVTNGETTSAGRVYNYTGSSGGSITLSSLAIAGVNSYTMWFRCDISGNFTINAGANTVIRDLNNNNVSSITISSGQAAKMIQYDGNGIYYLLN